MNFVTTVQRANQHRSVRKLLSGSFHHQDFSLLGTVSALLSLCVSLSGFSISVRAFSFPPSVYLCPSLRPFLCLPVPFSLPPSVCLCLFLSLCRSVSFSLSLCLSALFSPSLSVSVVRHIFPSLWRSVSAFLSLTISLCIYPSQCLSLLHPPPPTPPFRRPDTDITVMVDWA